ncbi:MAG: hypothetical protein NZ874_09975 [Fimbriimonadales bacterium]|nr:hypothetical protein [Fimbriimonadales bacterium]
MNCRVQAQHGHDRPCHIRSVGVPADNARTDSPCHRWLGQSCPSRRCVGVRADEKHGHDCPCYACTGKIPMPRV